jgi:hypothetical protein
VWVEEGKERNLDKREFSFVYNYVKRGLPSFIKICVSECFIREMVQNPNFLAIGVKLTLQELHQNPEWDK